MDLMSTIAGKTIPLSFLESVDKHTDLVALRLRDDDGSYREWTFRQYADAVARCVAGLRALGFGDNREP